MDGCRSFLVAGAMMLCGAVAGGLIGSPLGAVGGIVGACVLPWALVMGTLGWGRFAIPWALGRWLLGLPDWSTPRAVLAYLLTAPSSAVAAGLYLAMETNASSVLLVVVPVLFGAVAIPLSVVTAVFGRHGMLAFVAGAAEVSAS